MIHLDMQDKNLNNVNGVNINGSLHIKNNGTIKFDSASTYPSAIWEDTSIRKSCSLWRQWSSLRV